MKKIKRLLYMLALSIFLMGCAANTGDRTVADKYIENDNEINKENSRENTGKNFDDAEDLSTSFWIKYLDVMQADAALVQCEGHYMLIDGGNKEDSSLIYAVLMENEVEKLDYVIGSHPHADHIGGLPAAYNYSSVGETLCSVKSYETDIFEDLKKYASINGKEIIVPNSGDTYYLGPAKIDILGVNAGDSVNENSIIMKITYGDTSFLFTGDAEYAAEKEVIESGADLTASVLKVGHHGSDTSSSYHFIREVNPEIAVISVGKENNYGHPSESVLSRLADCGSQIYRTDLQGDITIYSDGKNVTVETEKNVTDEEIMVPGTWKNGAVSDEEIATSSSIDADYVCNENSKKFHYPACDSVDKMSEKNKHYFSGSREELISIGYEPCGGCNP